MLGRADIPKPRRYTHADGTDYAFGEISGVRFEWNGCLRYNIAPLAAGARHPAGGWPAGNRGNVT